MVARSVRSIDERRLLAVLDRGDGEVLAAGNAVAAGPDAGDRRAALAVDGDPTVRQLDQFARAIRVGRQEGLPDRLEQLAAGQRQGAGAAVGIFELDAGQLAVLGEQPRRLQPVPDQHAVGLGQLLLEREAFICSGPRR